MRPAALRERVNWLVSAFRISKLRACELVELGRSTYYQKSTAKDQSPLRKRLRELAEARPRFGYPRLHVLLRREGWMVNIKRVYRLYKLEGLGVEKKKRKKRGSHLRVVPNAPNRANQRWSMDFVQDSLLDGRKFRALTVMDVFTRECLAVHADGSLSGKKVAAVLEQVAMGRGFPSQITVDNGTEFFSKAMDAWAYHRRVKLDFIRPGRPMENGHIESFNGRLRDECLNAELFSDLLDARKKLEAWKHDYNENRPHGSIGNLTPVEFARTVRMDDPKEATSSS
jgi:putative transposase